MASDRVTQADVESLGWNSIDADNPVLAQRVIASQLNLMSRLLLEIRDALQPYAPAGCTPDKPCRFHHTRSR